MKKLTALLFSGILSVSAFAQELPKNLGIPEKYENYREAIQLPHFNFQMGPMSVHAHNYDIDGDGIEDVTEVYPILEFGPNGEIRITDYPLVYGFELHDKEDFSSDELLYDIEMNGLDGSEEWGKEEAKFRMSDGII